MTMRKSLGLVLVAALAGPAAAEPLAELAEQVRQSEIAFAKTVADRDYAALSKFIADDAVFFGISSVQRGKTAVLAAWKPLYDGPKAPFSWGPETVEVAESGTLAHSSGPVVDASGKGKKMGVYNSIWRREKDGRWRVVFDKPCDCAIACAASKP
jgi:ketosteroid isomerase-like protein